MKHRIGFNRLGRRPSHRISMLRNMVTSFILHEYITTTHTKALAAKRIAEKMITKAKVDTLHNRRLVAKDIRNKVALGKLFTIFGPMFTDRPGGYTRVLKIGKRKSDGSEMAILQLIKQDNTLAKQQNTENNTAS